MTTAGEPPSRLETEFSGSGSQLRFGALLWTERTSWRELLDAAKAAEQAGFSSIWCSDHLVASTGPPDDPCFELWTTLAAIGTSTSRALIGPLVAAIALRNPGVTSKAVTTLDHITGGRAVLGLGSGWLKLEYGSHGIPFGDGAAVRALRLEEGIQIIQQLLAGETVTHHSECYEMAAAKHAPKPIQPKIPLLIGGQGPSVLPMVARFADMWNARGGVDEIALAGTALRGLCQRFGRPYNEIERLTNRWVCIRASRPDAERSLASSLAKHGIPDYNRGIVALGSPEEVADQLAPTVNAGFNHIVCSLRSPFDYETINRFHEVAEILAGHTAVASP